MSNSSNINVTNDCPPLDVWHQVRSQVILSPVTCTVGKAENSKKWQHVHVGKLYYYVMRQDERGRKPYLFSEPVSGGQIQNSTLFKKCLLWSRGVCDALPLTFDLGEQMSDNKKSLILHIYQPVLQTHMLVHAKKKFVKKLFFCVCEKTFKVKILKFSKITSYIYLIKIISKILMSNILKLMKQ